MAQDDVLVGCCGFPEVQARYVAELRAVEVQQTFYDPPRRATLARWREIAGPGFRFAINPRRCRAGSRS